MSGSTRDRIDSLASLRYLYGTVNNPQQSTFTSFFVELVPGVINVHSRMIESILWGTSKGRSIAILLNSWPAWRLNINLGIDILVYICKYLTGKLPGMSGHSQSRHGLETRRTSKRL